MKRDPRTAKAHAWETRRAKYGPSGHSPAAYMRSRARSGRTRPAAAVEGNVRQPTGWPRAATPCDLVPKWAGEFRDFNDWVSFATPRLAGAYGRFGQDVAPICVDALGRRCNIGGDFMRARDEGAFPVRYFWECE